MYDYNKEFGNANYGDEFDKARDALNDDAGGPSDGHARFDVAKPIYGQPQAGYAQMLPPSLSMFQAGIRAPFIGASIHWVHKVPMLCLGRDECPICERRFKLYELAKELGQTSQNKGDEWNIANGLNPKGVMYAQVWDWTAGGMDKQWTEDGTGLKPKLLELTTSYNKKGTFDQMQRYFTMPGVDPVNPGSGMMFKYERTCTASNPSNNDFTREISEYQRDVALPTLPDGRTGWDLIAPNLIDLREIPESYRKTPEEMIQIWQTKGGAQYNLPVDQAGGGQKQQQQKTSDHPYGGPAPA
tara:strand:- start:741 stop:1637 length:897 start_codon:yes stop_codon:yes gene_type:complete